MKLLAWTLPSTIEHTFLDSPTLLLLYVQKDIMIWVFHTSSKQSPVHSNFFIQTKLKNEQQPCNRVRVDEYGYLENLTDVTNLLVDDFTISMETTGCDASWINENNEIHNRIINNMVIEGLVNINRNENK